MGTDSQDSADFPSGRAAEYQPLPTHGRTDPADVLLDAKDVAEWLHVTEDWVWDHASRRAPFFAGNLAFRWGFALQAQQDRRICRRERTPVHQAPEASVKMWDRPN